MQQKKTKAEPKMKPRPSRLAQIARHSTLSLDPAGYEDLLPGSIRWAKEHGFTELTLNPNNLSSYISHVIEHADEFPGFAGEVKRLLTDEKLRGAEFEHALVAYIIRQFLEQFDRVSYEVDADIELERFREGWEGRPEPERQGMEEGMTQRTVKDILRIRSIGREKMLVKVPNTPVGHKAVARVKEGPADGDAPINFTLFFSLEKSIEGLRHLGPRDVLSQFVSRIDALTQDKGKYGIHLNYAQGLVGLIIAKQFYDHCKQHKVSTRIIMASLGVKTDIPGWMYVYCLAGGGQILTMPLRQARAIEEDDGVPPIRDNLSLPMEEFLLPFVRHPKCIEEARKRGFWGGYAGDDEGGMAEQRARELIRKAVDEWNGLDDRIRSRIFAALAEEGFRKFYEPFSEARTRIKSLEQLEEKQQK